MVAEQNNLALMHLSAEGRLCRVSPVNVSVRSRVHEYGGLPYVVTNQTVYYSTFTTGIVYRQRFDEWSGTAGEPQALTPASHDLRYADFVVDILRHRLLCVREDHRTTPPLNTLVAIDLEQGGEGIVLLLIVVCYFALSVDTWRYAGFSGLVAPEYAVGTTRRYMLRSLNTKEI